MKHLALSSLLLIVLCSPVLAQNGQGQSGNSQGQNQGVYGAPGPIAGIGLPIIAIGFGVYWLVRRQRQIK